MRLWLFILFVALPNGLVMAALPDGGLFKPTFLLDDRSFAAGTAFLTRVTVEQHEYTVLVSCFHILGDAPQEIRAAAALSMTSPQLTLLAPRVVPVKGAREFTGWGAAGELSLFLVTTPPRGVKELKLAPTMPKVGDVVWLYARLYRTNAPKFYRGRVAGVSNVHLEYILDDSGLELGGTSGAPILNKQGEVVGINVGGGLKPEGQLYGIANPVVAFLPKMMEALAALDE